MRTLLNLAVVAALLCPIAAMAASPSPAPAASGSPAPATAPHRFDDTTRVNKALSQLTLSAAEKSKIQKIMADTSLHGRSRRDAISKVLTPEQAKQFASLTGGHRHHHHPGGSPSPAPSASASASPSTH